LLVSAVFASLLFNVMLNVRCFSYIPETWELVVLSVCLCLIVYIWW